MTSFSFSARLFAIVLSVSTCATAQGLFDRPAERKGVTYDLGVAAGMVGGAGLSLRRWSEHGHGLQINFLPYYLEEKYPEDGGDYYDRRLTGSSYDAFLSVGALYLKRVAQVGDISLFPFGGGSYTAAYSGGNYTEDNGMVRSGTTRKGNVALGGGLGAGFAFWRLEASVLIGLRGAYDLKTETRELTPSLDAAMHFRL